MSRRYYAPRGGGGSPALPAVINHINGQLEWYHDRAAKLIVVQTGQYHPQGKGIEICRMDPAREIEAKTICEMHWLLRASGGFAALGRRLAAEDMSEDARAMPLIADERAELDILVGHAVDLAASVDKVLGGSPAPRPRSAVSYAPKAVNRP